MHRGLHKIFDGWVYSGAARYSTLLHSDELGAGRRVGVLSVLSAASGVSSGSYSARLEHSPDGQTFMAKQSGTDVVSLMETGPTFQTLFRSETGAVQPNHRFVRFRILLTSTTAASMHVQLFVSVRGSPMAEETPTAAPCNLEPGRHAAHQHLSRELRQLAVDSSHLAPVDRALHLARSLSRESRAHLHEVDRRILALSPDVRNRAIGHVKELVVRAMATTAQTKPTEGCDCEAPKAPDAASPTATAPSGCAPCGGAPAPSGGR